MKKTYNSPTIEFYKIGLANIIAASGPEEQQVFEGEEDAANSLSNGFQGGFSWEDEN
ncbi:MAG: hypothetical protein ACI4TS_04445 [Bacteroidaceae bacterium]